jgi:quercetin dioxygenase-like cupin family protein
MSENKEEGRAMGVIHHRRVDENKIWQWENVPIEHYTTNNATKQVLIGQKDGAKNFQVRYFVIPPHGFSHLDEHSHDHGVFVTAGRARLQLGQEFFPVCEGDVIYIPSWERHQFENLGDEPFTFLCIIPPKPPPLEPEGAT